MGWSRSEYKPEYCQVAIDVLSSGRSLAGICAELDICRKTLYNWRDSEPEFAEAINTGLSKCQDKFESMGMTGMMGGVDKFSAPTWIFTMKNRFRADYQEDKESKVVSESIVEKLIDKLSEQ